MKAADNWRRRTVLAAARGEMEGEPAPTSEPNIFSFFSFNRELFCLSSRTQRETIGGFGGIGEEEKGRAGEGEMETEMQEGSRGEREREARKKRTKECAEGDG